MRLDVVVVGSANVDLVYRVAHMPSPGETVSAAGLSTFPGGKGLNQAVAACRTGAATALVATVGTDEYANVVTGVLIAEGMSTRWLRQVSGSTGTAVIAVDDAGENAIIVLGGANDTLTSLTDREKALVADAQVLLCQFEIPVNVVVEAAKAARQAGTTVILNPSPVRPVASELWDLVDVLVVNEQEAAQLAVRELDLPCVVATLGAEGATVTVNGEAPVHVPPRATTVVDTTGAGDTFVGSLAAELARGSAVEDAARRAVVAASLSVERTGAVPSIPTRSEVDSVLLTLGNEGHWAGWRPVGSLSPRSSDAGVGRHHE